VLTTTGLVNGKWQKNLTTHRIDTPQPIAKSVTGDYVTGPYTVPNFMQISQRERTGFWAWIVQAKHAKKFKLSYYKNCCSDHNQILHNDKDH